MNENYTAPQTLTLAEQVGEMAADPEQMERVYQAAREAGQENAFRQAVDSQHTAVPDNLLFAAWHVRLRQGAAQATAFVIAWAWVLPLALLNAAVFWWLSDEQFVISMQGYRGAMETFIPTLILLAGPVTAVFVLAYQAGAGGKRWLPAALISAGLLAAAGYVLLVYPRLGNRPFQEQYLNLMALHLPLPAWAGVGLFLTRGQPSPQSRFAFLLKSLEAFIVGGLFLIAGVLFTAISVGLFDALDVNMPDAVLRLFFAGGGGLIAVVAPAVVYDPTRPPAEQGFDQGLSRLIALLMRILLPLTLLVLLVYLAFIPFNFRAPFDNRDVLIIYNGMLFAVVALLVGATPLHRADLTPGLARWLRRGIIAVAALALLVSLYALAAILYRTTLDRLTPNRLAFSGWNMINIGLLALLLLWQARAGKDRWLPELQRTFSTTAVAYAGWTLFLILALPWLFGRGPANVDDLPVAIQRILYEETDPILLKCHNSPHIYLLDDGQKRWIDSIATFEAQGYHWNDVRFATCVDLRRVPDGVPIPADAGPPPQPYDN